MHVSQLTISQSAVTLIGFLMIGLQLKKIEETEFCDSNWETYSIRTFFQCGLYVIFNHKIHCSTMLTVALTYR